MDEAVNMDPGGARVWTVLTLELAVDQLEPVADRLREHFGMEPVQLERPETAHGWLELYFDAPAPARAAEQWVRAAVPAVRAAVLRRCDSRDWHAFWRTHFRTHTVGRRLLVCPAWDAEAPLEEGRSRLLIVPGLSFGTGEHLTTRFCLEMIDRLTVPSGPCCSLWDVGCGSGILAVAGALLGMETVLGTDSDPVCLDQSRANAALNGVSGRTDWRRQDILAAPADGAGGPYDLVCANLFASLLMQSAERLWAETGAYLALSGIREVEVDAVAATFARLGAREVVRDGDGAWAGLLFKR